MRSETSIRLNRKGGVLTLRFVLILATALLILPPGFDQPLPVFGTAVVALFLLSNFVLVAVPEARLLEPRAGFFFVLTDSFLVGLGLFYANNGRPELPVAFFVILLLSAMGRDLPRIVVSATIVAGFYLFLSHRSGMDAGVPLVQSLLRIPFLYITGLYYGAAIMRVREDQERASRLEMQRMDLEAFMEVTKATTSSLELPTVLRTIVQRVAQMVDAIRCSIILIKNPGRQCIVMASNDDPKLEPLQLDLRKYPELRRAIDTRKTVVINNVEKEPMMSDVRDILREKKFHSIMVIPVTFQKEMLGMLFLGAARSQKKFSPTEIKACQVVANASANALKNAILYDQVQDEAKRRKATSEVLRNIMEHFPDMIFLADLQGNITEFNSGGAALLGVSREKVIGTPATALFAGGQIPLSHEELLQQGGSVSNCQVLLKGAKGDLRHGLAALAVLRDEAGNPNGIVGVCKDITDLKKAQRQLQQAQAFSTIERISELVHKMNGPLTKVFGSAKFLMGGNHDSKTAQEGETILESARECQKIVEGLLNISEGRQSN